MEEFPVSNHQHKHRRGSAADAVGDYGGENATTSRQAADIGLMNGNKKIVLGVTGSIAAYKAADLTSLLTKAGADVYVVMTSDAQKFITPLPFKTLSRHPVITDLYDEEEGWKPTHIRVADEADLFLVAPATANVLA